MVVGCCSCCAAFRPRYKKLVDHIFPPNPEDGLVKSNMEKLVWYAMHSPDKLDRIGEYLAHRLDRDIHRRRTGYVVIAMDALDQLLVACHANNLNLFVDSFLQMIQKLLESQEPMLQLRATESFEKYANIREDTPQYHRRYDFFVSKFASMCYFNDSDLDKRKQLRTAGIMGLQGVVRKADFDDLGDNIWRSIHMDKIVPALLFNMEEKISSVEKTQTVETEDATDHEQQREKRPYELAEICLRELVCRATSGKITNIIKPLLFHLDLHELWVNNEFAVQTFKILMYAIQVQNSVSVIKMLIAHLNKKSNASIRCRIGIADVLSKVIPIAAGECIGPSVIDIINSLLEQIRSSLVGEKEKTEEKLEAEDASYEKLYQDTLIHALGEYANHLPDYQKIESMVFILNKVPGSDRIDDLEKPRPEGEVKLQHLLLKSLLKVGTKYCTVNYTTTFSHSFLVRLMRMSVSSDPKVRLTVQLILHTLIDRHNNTSKLAKATIDVALLKLNTGKIVRQDVNFWKKSGNEILLSIQENCEFTNNTLENIESMYTTLMLLLTEIRHDDVVLDILRVSFHIQTIAVDNSNGLSNTTRIQILALVASIMIAVSHCIQSLKDHVRNVIEKRSTEAPHLLPDLLPHYGSPAPIVENVAPDLLFNNDTVFRILKESDLDERRLTANVSSMIRRPSTFRHQSNSVSDINSLSVEVDSAGSSPSLPRRPFEEEVTFESLKKVLSESPEVKQKVEEEKRKLFMEELMSEPFEVLVAKVQQRNGLQSKLSEIFSRLPPTYQQNPAVSTASISVSQPAVNSTFTTSTAFTGSYDRKLNLVSSNAPYELPYPDIIIY